ncbi:ciliary-associated calcium-binding coiled-coil protein 1-like isoform X2 [Dysidea avara]|uniref:ciliary-associated calcium-binding coiled-coil protein 1-like isoform X2 n=1 Tax=Dysidea avara TaxID=196820 RepID=UPI00332E96B9
MQKSASKGRLSAQDSKSSRTSKGRKETQEESINEEEEPEVVLLAWQVVSEDFLTDAAKLSVEDVLIKFAEVLSYPNHRESLQEAALLDVYVAAYWLGKEQEFSNQQLSSFITVLHKLIGNCKDGVSLAENITEFQQLLVDVGITDKCPLGQFSREQAKWLTDYIMTSIFQHYHLYQYLFTEVQEEERITLKLPMNVPPPSSSFMPPPLEEAIPESFYQKYVNPHPKLPEESEPHSDVATRLSEEALTVAADVLEGVTAGEVKNVIEKIAATTITSFQNEVIQKLQDKEKSIIKQLNQIEKTVK